MDFTGTLNFNSDETEASLTTPDETFDLLKAGVQDEQQARNTAAAELRGSFSANSSIVVSGEERTIGTVGVIDMSSARSA